MVLFFEVMHECVSVCRYMHVSAGAHGGQKRAADPTEAGVTGSYRSCSMWGMGTELGSSGRTAFLSTPHAAEKSLLGFQSLTG